MGKGTDYDYTFRGWLDSRVDGEGQTNRFNYDPLGRLASVTLDSDTLLSLKYDVLSQVTNVVSDYSEFDYKYDSLNRATQTVANCRQVFHGTNETTFIAELESAHEFRSHLSL